MRGWLNRALAFAPLLVALACETETPASSPTTCEKDESCREGYSCVTIPFDGHTLRACRPACDPTGDSSDCPKGEHCEDFARDPARGYCTPRCSSDASCAKGFSCDRETGECKCPSDEACNDASGAYAGESFTCRGGDCTRACETDLQCACGSVCNGGACELGCHADTDCCGGAVCQAGRCTAPTPAPSGGRCFRSQDCASEICVEGIYPRGLCITKVVDHCAVNGCPAGTGCDSVYVPWQDRMYGICAPGCDTDADCREGTVCRPTETQSGGPERRVCTPSCSAGFAGCGPNGRCDASSGTCACASDTWCKPYGSLATCATKSATCTCTPDCRGKQCGGDGCGGSCGTCEKGYACNQKGLCTGACGSATPYTVCADDSICPPSSTCGGGQCTCNKGYVKKPCGDDGENVCKDGCALDWTCKVCVPSCSGKQCGDDGCGGSCGSCSSGAVCSSGRCVTSGGGGGGGGGGGCPNGCPSGTTCVTNQGCITTCTSGSQCQSGCCTALTNGQRVCADASYCQGTGGGGGGGGAGCHDRTSCISARATYPTGAGHCAGEMVGFLKNSCNAAIYCQWCLGTDCGNGATIGAGRELGGELGGVWACGQSTGAQLRYLCADTSDPHACSSF